MENNKEIKVENIGKTISSVLLDSISIHNDAMILARFGATSMDDRSKSGPNQTRIKRLLSLGLVMASQIGMIRTSKSQVRIASLKEYDKEYNTPEAKKANPFKKEHNDYNELDAILKTLNKFDKFVRLNARSNVRGRRFIETVQQPHEHYDVGDYKLTENFFDMIGELEETYDGIDYIITCRGLITDVTEAAARKKKLTQF